LPANHAMGNFVPTVESQTESRRARCQNVDALPDRGLPSGGPLRGAEWCERRNVQSFALLQKLHSGRICNGDSNTRQRRCHYFKDVIKLGALWASPGARLAFRTRLRRKRREGGQSHQIGRLGFSGKLHKQTIEGVTDAVQLHREKGRAARKQRHGAGASVRLSQPKA